MVTCAVHQPNFAPWLGYFVKLAFVEHFVFLDNVRFSKGSYTNRVKVRDLQGKVVWLTVPLQRRGLSQTNIVDVRIADPDSFHSKLLEQLKRYYQNARYREDLISVVESANLSRPHSLAVFNIELVRRICEVANVSTQVSVASEMSDLRQHPSERLADICEQVGADRYICGAGSTGYQERDPFLSKGIEVYRYSFDEPPIATHNHDRALGLSVLERIAHRGIEGFSTDLHEAISRSRLQAVS